MWMLSPSPLGIVENEQVGSDAGFHTLHRFPTRRRCLQVPGVRLPEQPKGAKQRNLSADNQNTRGFNGSIGHSFHVLYKIGYGGKQDGMEKFR